MFVRRCGLGAGLTLKMEQVASLSLGSVEYMSHVHRAYSDSFRVLWVHMALFKNCVVLRKNGTSFSTEESDFLSLVWTRMGICSTYSAQDHHEFHANPKSILG